MGSEYEISSSSSDYFNWIDGANRSRNIIKDNDEGKMSFNIDDIESLQDAEIDNRLLEFHFLSPSKQEVLKREILLKHARNFGYILIPRNDLYETKYRHTYEKKEQYYTEKYEIEQKVKELSNRIFLLKKKYSELED